MMKSIIILLFIISFGCCGSFNICEDRTVAFFHSKHGDYLVLVSNQAINDFPEQYREPSWDELSSTEHEQAIKMLLLGGRCHATGAVIPQATKEEARGIWYGEFRMNRQRLHVLYPQLSSFQIGELASNAVEFGFPLLDTMAGMDERRKAWHKVVLSLESNNANH